MGPTVFDDLDELLQCGPTDLGKTDWWEVDSAAIARFASATRRPAPGPAEPIPGFMLLALTNRFFPQLMEVRGASSGVNYGTGQVRFPALAGPGDRLRASGFLVQADEVPGGVQTTVKLRVEVEGVEDPCCVVESLSRWLR